MEDASSSSTATSPRTEHAKKGGVERRATTLERAGSTLMRASSNMQLQRASTLPTEPGELRHAATMPMMFDVEADRPWCGGLWKTQQLVGFVAGVTLAVVLSCVRPMETYPQANDMMGITSLCACFWVFEVIPVYITALFPLVLMPLLKVTSSEIAAQAYWNWISLLVVSVFLVDIALEQVHLPRRIALKLLLKVGVVHPASLLGCFMLLCWVFSMVFNCIAVTIMITPFAIGLMNAAEGQARSDVSEEQSVEDGPSAEERAKACESAVGKVQRLSDCLLLGIAYSATSGGIATITGTVNHYFLAGEAMVAGEVTWNRWFLFGFPISMATVVLAYAALYLRYIHGLKFNGIDREVLRAEYEELLDEVGPFSRDELIGGLVLLSQVVLLVIRPFAISPFLESDFGSNLVNDASVACMPALLLFFIPSVVRPGQALITWTAVHEKFDFGILLLIGGALAISSGFVQSGLNIALGSAFAQVIMHVHSALLEFVIILSIALCCQLFSSIGTAAAMLPVMSSAALQAVINPMALLLPATVATSFAFVLPTATPSNIVVLAKSQELLRPLRFRDFFCCGLPLTVVACVVGALLTRAMGEVVFDSRAPFPQWACDAAAGSCTFLDVPGTVGGRHVASQACIVDMTAPDGSLCRLWNGTMLSVAQFAPGA